MEIKLISNDLWRALERDIITTLEVAKVDIPIWLVPSLLLAVRLTINRAVLEALAGTLWAIDRDEDLHPFLEDVKAGKESRVPDLEETLQAP